jgi:hypothetical protein
MFDSSWTGAMPDQNFFAQKIPLYMRFYPFVILSGVFYFFKEKYITLFKGKKVDENLFIVFFVLRIIGVLLTKQSSRPFDGLYEWLFLNVPGFNLFREASKFYIITALSGL